MPIRTLHIGLGPIGNAVVKQCATRNGFTVAGAVDIDPEKIGEDLGEVVGLARKLRIRVGDDITRTIRATKPDVAILCTSSSLAKVMPQVEAVLKAKVPIVSTTEEMAYPAARNRKLTKKIDELAKKARVAVLGTGVNPGFTMDALPITLTGVCADVKTIRVDRIQDASIRRLPFQQKIGAGLTEAEFRAKVDGGTVRHVGLAESITMIAEAMGWKLDRITDEIRPKIAEREVSSTFLTVERGRVCGLIQDGIGYRKGEPIITLHMEAYLGSPETFDAVTIEGTPALSMKIAGGVHGDVATASIAVNSIPKVIQGTPGFHTMRSLPIPSWYGGR
jgi:4-hydroxy-tetrahydrodipicolinate reductase